MIHTFVTKTLFGLAFASLVVASAFAQSPANTGTIEGTVTDQNGGNLEGALETFNLFNSENLKQPQNGNLLLNFDGTLTSGLGDPRQAQQGVNRLF